jgi:hypothetical protein
MKQRQQERFSGEQGRFVIEAIKTREGLQYTLNPVLGALHGPRLKGRLVTMEPIQPHALLRGVMSPSGSISLANSLTLHCRQRGSGHRTLEQFKREARARA